ncbi:MAG: hypothetical protein ACTHK0_13095 [Ginsengibacter sp.]
MNNSSTSAMPTLLNKNYWREVIPTMKQNLAAEEFIIWMQQPQGKFTNE